MILHDPITITSRLLPGVKVGDMTISIERKSEAPDRLGRSTYQFYIDIPGRASYKDVIRSGMPVVGHPNNLQRALASLLTFMSACGDSWDVAPKQRGDNAHLFPLRIAERCKDHEEELGILSMHLEEMPGLIEE